MIVLPGLIATGHEFFRNSSSSCFISVVGRETSNHMSNSQRFRITTL